MRLDPAEPGQEGKKMAVDLWFGLVVLLFFGTAAVLSALCDWIELHMAGKRRWRR